MSDRHEIMGEAIRHIMHVLLHSEQPGEDMTMDDRIAYALGFYMSSYLKAQSFWSGKKAEDNPYTGVDQDYEFDAWKEGYYNAAK